MAKQDENRVGQDEGTAGRAAEDAAVVAEAAEASGKMPELYVERRPFKFKGEMMYGYTVTASLRGKTFKIELAPRDNAGYLPLEVVFENRSQAKLEIAYNPYKDDFGVRKTSYAYSVQSEDGVLTVPIWPRIKSDSTKLEMLIAESVAAHKAKEAAANNTGSTGGSVVG